MYYFLQFYKAFCVFDKTNYTAVSRKESFVYEEKLESDSGRILGDVLLLPEEYKEQFNSKTVKLIILMDTILDRTGYPGNDQPDKATSLIDLDRVGSCRFFECFKICMTENSKFELHLEYDKNAWSIGIPQRENHKVSELKSEKAFRYLINGKSDFTMSGRKQRTFYEYEYIFESLRTASKIEFRKRADLLHVKNIPHDDLKTIDERKMLR